MNREHLTVSHSSSLRRPGRAPERAAAAVISAARGCSQDAAFDELIDVAMHHHVSVGCAAESLISLVGDDAGMAGGPAIVPPRWAELRDSCGADSTKAGADA